MSREPPPPLDINEASLLDFETTLHIERSQSAAVIAKREELGGFRSLSNLLLVRGITSRLVEKNRSRLACGPPSDSCCSSLPPTADIVDDDSLMESPSSRAAPPAPAAPLPSPPPPAPAVATVAAATAAAAAAAVTASADETGEACTLMKRKSDGASGRSPGKKRCRKEAGGGDESQSEHEPEAPADLQNWVDTYLAWSGEQRLVALDQLLDVSDSAQVRHMMQVIKPRFQRDFISLLPRELALHVLSFLPAGDLLRAAQTCRSWRLLAEDNLLWREKCRELQVDDLQELIQVRRRHAAPAEPDSSVWKQAYIRRMKIEANWRSRELPEPKVLNGHDDHVITCLQFSEHRIVSGSDDNTLKVWSSASGRCLRTLVGHTGGVWSSQMDGATVVSGSTDRTLKVWNADSGQCLHTLYGHTSTVRCMHLHGKKVVSGSRDATLRVWDIETGECEHVLVGHVAAVRCVQYNGKLVVSGAYDYMVKVWNPDREECLHTLQGHNNRVYSLQFDGVHVVSGSLDTSIRVWDVETGQCKHTLMGHQSLTSGMELKNNILVSGNADSTVKVWDILSGQCLQTLSGANKHQSAVTCLQFQNNFVMTSSDDGTVKLWDVKTGEFVRNLVSLDSGGSGGVVWRIRATRTKLVCAVGSRNGTEETKLLVLDFDPDHK
ncbi:F-box/WD repeat-containing protein 7-like [Pollicipes pollicipes]|uniref:F-box/WD repeat-containing protein 7-like n=1 Tax=Pollicipes pollicipes TaxID=41117 RepID=UPI001884B298|nr:F-box/WD repeat-containing protein 7-like [Pollicipes pollicipes]